MNIRLILCFLVALCFVGCSEVVDGNTGNGADGGGSTGDVSTSDGALGADSTVSDGSVSPNDGGVGVDTMPPDACDTCMPPAICIKGQCSNPVECIVGDSAGCASDTAIRECAEADDGTTGYIMVPCSAGYKCMGGECLPNLCEPGKSYCEGLNAKKQCNADGTAFLDVIECAEGEYCSGGNCGSSCQVDPKFGSHVGCDFWTVDLPNYPDPTLNPTPEDLPYAVVVSNPNEMDAVLTFEGPANFPVNLLDKTVPAGQSKVITMPVVNVQGTGVTDSAIKVSSSRPVLVHQFNPWDNVFSNDASLLLPEPMLGSDYVILSWPTSPLSLVSIPGFATPEDQNGYFTIIAASDDTQVTVNVTTKVAEGLNGKFKAMQPGGLQTVTLNRGEVLNIESIAETFASPVDLSGSTVSANKPIAVFSGHEEAVIGKEANGDGACCADHLEEQLMPSKLLGTEALAVKTKPRGGDVEHWRIQAAEPGVTINTIPPQPGADGVFLAKRGAWVEVVTMESFEVQADGLIQVAQYLVSQGATQDHTGDPSMIMSVPTDRFRASYVLMVPPDYDENWITVMAPVGESVTVDGTPVPAVDFQSFGGGVWNYAYVALTDGIHTIEGTQPFGLTAYGFNKAVSYGYPGGISD
jgi:hypothetical protein